MANILQYSVNSNSIGFLDKLYSAPSPPGIAAELLVASINNNSHVWHVSPALSTIEKRTATALANQFGLTGSEAGGVTMPGGAAANTTALLVARNLLLSSNKTNGVYGEDQRGAIFVSEAAHYSVANAAQIVGLAASSVYQIPVTEQGGMNTHVLRQSIEHAQSLGLKPIFVVATAGTTVKGAFDPVREVAAIAQECGAWFHVDACWGGAAVFSASLKGRLDGTELADSISFNPHKMLGVPLLCSFLLARDLRTFWCANKLTAGYLFHSNTAGEGVEAVPAPGVASQKPHLNGVNGVATGMNGAAKRDWRSSPAILQAPRAVEIADLASLTTQCGRRPDAVKFYLHWNYYGVEGMAKHVEGAVRSAEYMTALVSRTPSLVLVGGHVPFAQVCFYVRDQSGDGQRERSIADQSAANTRRTKALSAALRKSGWMVDFAPGNPQYGEYGDFMRVVCHRHVTVDVVERLFGAIVGEAEIISRE